MKEVLRVMPERVDRRGRPRPRPGRAPLHRRARPARYPKELVNGEYEWAAIRLADLD